MVLEQQNAARKPRKGWPSRDPHHTAPPRHPPHHTASTELRPQGPLRRHLPTRRVYGEGRAAPMVQMRTERQSRVFEPGASAPAKAGLGPRAAVVPSERAAQPPTWRCRLLHCRLLSLLRSSIGTALNERLAQGGHQSSSDGRCLPTLVRHGVMCCAAMKYGLPVHWATRMHRAATNSWSVPAARMRVPSSVVDERGHGRAIAGRLSCSSPKHQSVHVRTKYRARLHSQCSPTTTS